MENENIDNDIEDDEIACAGKSNKKYNGKDDDQNTMIAELIEDEDSSQDTTNTPVYTTAMSILTREHAWLYVIQANSLQVLPIARTIFDTARITHTVKYISLASAATSIS